MFNSVALDVVIGLVFIYLLYSLLATVLSEIIATKLGLRAKNLKEAVNRMLTDEKDGGLWHRLIDSLKLLKNPSNKIIDNFYNHPEIKYLGSSGLFKHPSSFKALSFSKTLLQVLFDDKPLTKETIEEKLQQIITQAKNNDKDKVLDTETARYINSLWVDSYGDIVKFKLQLEAWFDRTMEQATEWYKRKIQIVLLILGFMMAWVFNADTFTIIEKLSKDKDARDKVVSMANAYVQHNKTSVDTSLIKDSVELKTYTQKLDSLLKIKKDLDKEIQEANSLLGLGGWLPDSLQVSIDTKTKKKLYKPEIDPSALLDKHAAMQKGTLHFNTCNKWGYFFRLLPHHFFGFLITALAISLGAPFWFDMLNKLMKLRTSTKEESNTPSNSANSGGGVSPLNREG